MWPNLCQLREELRDQTYRLSDYYHFTIHDPKVREIYALHYDELLKQNKLLFTVDLVREMLTRAFQRDTDTDMANDLDEIIDTCRATKNSHFQWFARLIENHYEGIMAHASLQIASGKIEGD